jgi:hypothetical protein
VPISTLLVVAVALLVVSVTAVVEVPEVGATRSGVWKN